MKKICFFFLFFSFIHIQSSQIINLFLNHFDKKTKILSVSKKWILKESGFFSPRLETEDENGDPIPVENYDYAAVSPMIKVTASYVEFNGDGNTIINANPYQRGMIGIEVGYSPAELAADSSLVQPTNVVIKNITLADFDCGLIIHQGVKNVEIKQCMFKNISVGLVFMGTGTSTKTRVSNVSAKNCFMSGHNQNHKTALVDLKNTLEVTYGYGVDTFMPLRIDSLNADTVDVYSYIGVLMKYARDVELQDFKIDSLGYDDYGTVSEGNGGRTEAIGVVLRNSTECSIRKLSVYSITSELRAIGLQLDQVSSLSVQDSIFTQNQSAQHAVGIEVLNEQSVAYSLENTSFKNVTSSEHYSPEVVYGGFFKDVRNVTMDSVKFVKNNGGKKTYGLYGSNYSYSDIVSSVFSNNRSDRELNDVETDEGIVAFGIYLFNSKSLFLNRIDCSNNRATNSAYGSKLENCQNIRCSSLNCIANESTQKRFNEDTAIRAAQDTSEISKFAPVVTAGNTGAYGLVVKQCERVNFERCKCNMNNGHRAMGIVATESSLLSFDNIEANYQHATGDCLHSDIALVGQGGTVADKTALPVISEHASLLFGNATVNSALLTAVDLQKGVTDILTKFQAIRGNLFNDLETSYAIKEVFLAQLSLLSSSIARFRLWGVAFGLHLHNCQLCEIVNSSLTGQVSKQDSAVGCVLSGRNQDIFVKRSNLSRNHAWQDSQRQIGGNNDLYKASYNLTALKYFWEMILDTYVQAGSDVAIGFNTLNNQFVAQGQRGLDNQGDAITVQPTSGIEQTLVNVVGPVSAGIVVGDFCLGGVFSQNNMQANNGESGQSYGILVQTGYGLLFDRNVISDNSCNIYGYCCGMIDVSTHSANTYFSNELLYNKLSDSYNSNIMVVFDPNDPNAMLLPTTKLKTGLFQNKKTEKDNVEVSYPRSNNSYQVESVNNESYHQNIVNSWESNSWIK